jgi:uncharacterized protein YbgA (DUF1722 family)/uncharacterized protein YbbK (DUF523 family)
VSAPVAAGTGVPVRIGISSCLLGETVRYDGGHKRDRFLTDTFGRFVEWVPICPEVECGMGTPREPVRLIRVGALVRMQATKTGRDFTTAMGRVAARLAERLAHEPLHGYVLKKDSPSCGMERVKVYGESGMPARSGRGLFAQALMRRLPLLPVEEEGRLADPRLRENFVERVFAFRRLHELFDRRWGLGDLIRFHTTHKLVLMAHSPEAHLRLGRFVADVKGHPRAEARDRYRTAFMDALGVLATPRKHTNVLQHAAGYLRAALDPESRAELVATIEDYRQQLVPLVVPLTLLRHHIRRVGAAYLADQVYLDPHPNELMLRDHV